MKFILKFKYLLLASMLFSFHTYSQVKKDSSKNLKIKSDTILNPIDYIKKETIGGKLDFSKILKGYGGKTQEENKYKVYLYSIAIWTYSVKDLGISDKKKIVKLWEEIHQRRMTKDEKKAVDKGLEEN